MTAERSEPIPFDKKKKEPGGFDAGQKSSHEATHAPNHPLHLSFRYATELINLNPDHVVEGFGGVQFQFRDIHGEIHGMTSNSPQDSTEGTHVMIFERIQEGRTSITTLFRTTNDEIRIDPKRQWALEAQSFLDIHFGPLPSGEPHPERAEAEQQEIFKIGALYEQVHLIDENIANADYVDNFLQDMRLVLGQEEPVAPVDETDYRTRFAEAVEGLVNKKIKTREWVSSKNQAEIAVRTITDKDDKPLETQIVRQTRRSEGGSDETRLCEWWFTQEDIFYREALIARELSKPNMGASAIQRVVTNEQLTEAMAILIDPKNRFDIELRQRPL